MFVCANWQFFLELSFVRMRLWPVEYKEVL